MTFPVTFTGLLTSNSAAVDCPSEVLVLRQNRQLLVGLQELKRTVTEEQTRHRATRVHFDVLQSLCWIGFQKERPSGCIGFGLPRQNATRFRNAHSLTLLRLIPLLRLRQAFAELFQESAIDIVQTIIAARNREWVRGCRIQWIGRPMILGLERAIIESADTSSVPNSVRDFRLAVGQPRRGIRCLRFSRLQRGQQHRYQ